MASARTSLVSDGWESKDFKAESLRLFGFHDRGSLVGLDIFDDFGDDRWRYKVDNAFASGLDFVQLPESDRVLQSCCQPCDDMLFGGQARQQTEIYVVQDGCPLCYYIAESLRARGEEHQAGLSLLRDGSYLALGAQRVLTIRRPAGQKSSLGKRLGEATELMRSPASTTANIQIGIPTVQEAGSSEYFRILQAWLDHCDENHDCMSGRIKKADLPKRVLDTRLADEGYTIIKDTSLLETQECDYIAFSHRWGDYTADEKERICTHDGNLARRQHLFSIDVLPVAFQHAIVYANRLGVRYLWIDSLCIIQSLDGRETADWKAESRRMEHVYANAICTLAIHGTYDIADGPLHRQTKRSFIRANTSKGVLLSADQVDDFLNEIEKSNLSSRGWVVQERVLSRRILHCGTEQTYFACGQGVRCENFAFIKPPHLKKHFVLEPHFQGRLVKAEPFRIVQFLQWFCQEYSKRELSIMTDRSRAFFGLEQRIAKAIQTASAFGIFHKYVHRLLLWQRPQATRLHVIKYATPEKVPSWSWYYVYGEIEYPIAATFEMEWLPNVSISQDSNELMCEAASFLNIALDMESVNGKLLDRDKNFVGSTRFDFDSDCLDPLLHRCVVLGRGKQGRGKQDRREYRGLVIEPTGVSKQYKRVGTVVVQSQHLSRSRSAVHVV